MEESKLIKMLQKSDTKFQALHYLEKEESISEKVLNQLILTAIDERDVSANGYFITPFIKKIGLQRLSDFILEFVQGEDLFRKIGAIKLLYWVREEEVDFDENTMKPIFYEQSKINNQIEYSKRKKILIEEYYKCRNSVVRFFFQWGMPDERNKLLKDEPETDEELLIKIKGNKELEKLFWSYLAKD